MMSPKVVLFDLGNVLIHFNPESFWIKLGLLRIEDRSAYQEGVQKAGVRFESGIISTNQFLQALQQVFGDKFGLHELQNAVSSVLTLPIDGMESVVARTAKRAMVGLVSNTNEYHYAYCASVLPALKHIPKQYLSYKMGVMKPHPEFYRMVILDLGVDASGILFVDDVELNVRAAEKEGMQGVMFKNPRKLEEILRNLGIL